MAKSTRGGASRGARYSAGSATHLCRLRRSVATVLAQAITTDTQGIVAGDLEVPIGNYGMPVFEARPGDGRPLPPIILVLSEIWGVHECVRDLNVAASPRRGSTRSRPSSSSARAGLALSPERPGHPEDRLGRPAQAAAG